MRQNAFGQEIPELGELLKDASLARYITNTLTAIIKMMHPEAPGYLEPTPLFLAEQIVRNAGVASHETGLYEKATNITLQWSGYGSARTTKALAGRAATVHSQIASHVKGTVLDIGCGDGQIGKKLAQAGHDVVLADVYKNPNIESTGLEFLLFGQGEKIPNARQYDTTLLLTVMHHSDDPIGTLRDAQRRTKDDGKIVIIESVYGIEPDVREPSYGEVADNISKEFKSLTPEQQRKANIFFDHFYNRVVHFSEDLTKKVNVPFNFRAPFGSESWETIFKSLGLKQVHFEYLGMDQPIVPEYHTLHVLHPRK